MLDTSLLENCFRLVGDLPDLVGFRLKQSATVDQPVPQANTRASRKPVLNQSHTMPLFVLFGGMNGDVQ
jgi:hypothetical protein